MIPNLLRKIRYKFNKAGLDETTTNTNGKFKAEAAKETCMSMSTTLQRSLGIGVSIRAKVVNSFPFYSSVVSPVTEVN